MYDSNCLDSSCTREKTYCVGETFFILSISLFVFSIKSTKYHSGALKHELKDDNYTTIRSGLDCLITTNELLAELLYMSKCTPAEKNINYIEEAMCHQIFKHFGYFVLYYFIGVIGLIILGVGFNKLILVLRKLQKTSVRGNKQFKDEFGDD